ncbi:MAG: PLP-dependent aminotransferase family protein [Anaerolineaceae bacterium]|nr:PLP-dependent aminotransferase family protein [Anaerolineaceae bacterium]
MGKNISFIPLGIISLEKGASTPLYYQVYEQLRFAILQRQLAGGVRLPSTRALSEELSVSRNTIVNAFEQLIAEGYIEGKIGSGSFVTSSLPDDILQMRNRQKIKANFVKSDGIFEKQTLSRRGARIAKIPVVRGIRSACAFRPGVPALDAFPFRVWKKLADRHYQQNNPELLCYGDPAGYLPLRKAISAYLGAARGLRCDYEQVIIVTGSQQGMELSGRLLLDPRDAVWVEDPCYPNARRVLSGTGAHLISVPVDEEGLDIEAGLSNSETNIRMVYITPSHQYPLGVRMSLARRLKLLDWARQNNSWVLEDDYDSEYRYKGRPLVALQGLDQSGVVIYLGTFSKVMFPSLRLGYIIVPPNLVDPFTKALAVTNRGIPTIEQAIMTDFITAGHFARHIRRMRNLYAERQAVLVNEIRKRLSGVLEVNPVDSGLNLIGWLANKDDQEVSIQLASAGIVAPPISDYTEKAEIPSGLLLGYAGVNETQICEGIARMTEILIP